MLANKTCYYCQKKTNIFEIICLLVCGYNIAVRIKLGDEYT